MNDVYFPDLSPFKTGLAGKCPRCGRGKLFNGYLTVADRCSSCGLSYAFADGGDGAAWFVFGSVLLRAGERARAADAHNRAYVLGLAQGPNY